MQFSSIIYEVYFNHTLVPLTLSILFLFFYNAVWWKTSTLLRIVCSTCLQTFLKTISFVSHKCHNRSIWDSTAKDELSCGIAFLWKSGSVWNIDDLMVLNDFLGSDVKSGLLFRFLSTDRREFIACPEKSGKTIEPQRSKLIKTIKK